MRLTESSTRAIASAAAALAMATVLAAGAPSNAEAPNELGNQALAALGFVDVTAAPFSADPQGEHDSTEAIQRAIVFARDRQMVCFFPSGVYKISDTLHCNSTVRWFAKEDVVARGIIRVCCSARVGRRRDRGSCWRLALRVFPIPKIRSTSFISGPWERARRLPSINSSRILT